MSGDFLYYSNIKYYDIANGVGVRTSLFVSGCTHHCKNCFNKVTWDFKNGEEFTEDVLNKILDSCDAYYVAGLSLLGGEPMEPENQEGILSLLQKFKERFPDKTVWCYSGYTYEELTGIIKSRCRTEITDKILMYIDVLVDGEYVEELHDITLKFRGSSNQRLIDLNKTRQNKAITIWHDDPLFDKHSI